MDSIGKIACATAVCLCASSRSAAQDVFLLVEQQRVGRVDGREALTYISDVLVSRDGKTLFIAQPVTSDIRVFDIHSGGFIKSIGRRGAGPGEFASLTTIGWKADTIVGIERRDSRLVVFQQDGQHVRTVSVVARRGSTIKAHPVPIVPAPNGSYWAEPLPASAPDRSPIPVVLMSEDGTQQKINATRMNNRIERTAVIGESVLKYTAPFATWNWSAYAADGSSVLLIEVSDRKRLFNAKRISYRGDTIYNRTFSYEPTKVPPVVAQGIYQRYSRLMTRRVGAARSMEAARKTIALPEYQPPVSHVHLSESGEAWLRLHELGKKSVTWMILDPVGRIRGTVLVPSDVTIQWVNGDSVWGSTTSELDVPQLVRYRLVTR